MKVGVLCEGELTDKPVLELLLGHMFPSLHLEVRGVTKRRIFEYGDIELMSLFASGADRALILWDLLPVGEQMGIRVQASRQASRREQRETLLGLLCRSSHLSQPLLQQAHYFAYDYGFASLKASPVPHPNGGDDLFRLVCVCFALDGWLLSDHDLLCELASKVTHPVRRLNPAPGDPDSTPNPAGALQRAFAAAPNKYYRYYNKQIHNPAIAKAYVDRGKVERMRASQSFRRVADAVADWART